MTIYAFQFSNKIIFYAFYSSSFSHSRFFQSCFIFHFSLKLQIWPKLYTQSKNEIYSPKKNYYYEANTKKEYDDDKKRVNEISFSRRNFFYDIQRCENVSIFSAYWKLKKIKNFCVYVRTSARTHTYIVH